MLSHPNIVLLRVRMSLLDPKWYLRFCLGRTIFCRYNVHRINSAKIHRPKRVLKVYLLLSAYLEMSSIFAFISYFVRNSYCLMLFCVTLLNIFFFFEFTRRYFCYAFVNFMLNDYVCGEGISGCCGCEYVFHSVHYVSGWMTLWICLQFDALIFEWLAIYLRLINKTNIFLQT